MSMKSTAAANICGAFAIFYVPFGLSLTAQQLTSSSAPNVACTKIVSDGTAKANQVTKFTGACKIEPSAIYESSGHVGIDTPALAMPMALGGVQVLGVNNNSGGALVDFDFDGLNTGSSSNPGALYRMDLRPGQPTHQWWTRTAGTPFPSTLEDARMVILQNGNVGIGTTNPQNLLQIAGIPTTSTFITPFVTQINGGGQFQIANFAGPIGNAVAGDTLIDNTVGSLIISPNSSGHDLKFVAGSWTNPISMIIKDGGGVGIGTINPQYLLSVNGTIQGKEVIVNTGWSDYVFGPEYRLKPLT